MLRKGLVATDYYVHVRYNACQQDVLGMTDTKSRHVTIEAILNILVFTSRKNQKKYLFKNISKHIQLRTSYVELVANVKQKES